MKKLKNVGFATLCVIIALSCITIFCESLPPYNGETTESIAEGKKWLIGAVIAGLLAMFGIWLIHRRTASSN